MYIGGANLSKHEAAVRTPDRSFVHLKNVYRSIVEDARFPIFKIPEPEPDQSSGVRIEHYGASIRGPDWVPAAANRRTDLELLVGSGVCDPYFSTIGQPSGAGGGEEFRFRSLRGRLGYLLDGISSETAVRRDAD